MRACPSCGESNPDRFSACAFCGTVLVEAREAREKRRVLTVVFCDLKDSTGLGERLDPEALGEVLDLYFTSMTKVLTRHGGTIQKFIGDAIVAAFGIPTLHEDDALRAVRAAIEMRQALARLNRQVEAAYGVRLATRTGVHTGEVVIREAVNDQQVLTGDTLNTGARLEQAADEGEILIGEPTYRLVRGAVEVEAVPPLDLRGKSAPVAAYRLLGVFGDEQAARRHLAPFVGRERELEELKARYDRAVSLRRCQLATVLGEAGVGKSRLVRAVLDSVRHEARVLRGRCLPYGESITFWPLLSIMREAAGIEQDETGEVARAKVERLSGDVEIARRVASALDWSQEDLPVAELFWGIREALVGMARDQPLVIVIDDVHWAAPTLIELIEHLIDEVTDAPILLLCTARPLMLEARPTWSEGESATRLMLARLPDEASAQLIANMTGGLEMPAPLNRTILRAAEGNPLFVEQLVSMLMDEGTLVQVKGRWQATRDLAHLDVPPSIQALLSARLDLLESGERGVVDPASVIGLEFPSVAVRTIAAPAVQDSAPVQLASLERKHLVRHEPSSDERNDYRFDHLLIRDAAYAGILKRERAQLHERFAEWLERSEAAEDRDDVVGFHLEQAARYQGELGSRDDHALELARRASEKLVAAGRRAFARGDLPAAVDLLRRAHAALAGDEAARAVIVPELAEALMESGDFAAARDVIGEVVAAGDDAPSRLAAARSRLVLLLVDYYSGTEGNWASRAEAEVERTIPMFEASGHQSGLATAWRVRYGAQISANRYDLAAESANRIVQHAEAAGDVLQQRRGATGYALAMLLGSTPVVEALERAESLVEAVEGDRRTQSVIMLFVAQLAAMDGQIDRARETYRQARDMLEELGQGVLAASTSTDAAPVEVLAGDLDAAERMLRADDVALEALGENYLRSTVAGLLARVLVMKGEFAEAERVAERTRSFAAADDVDAQVLWRSSLSRCYAARGRTDEAVSLANEAVALTDGVAAPILRAEALTDLAVVLAAADRVEDARARFAEALAMHEVKGNRRGADELRELAGSMVGS